MYTFLRSHNKCLIGLVSLLLTAGCLAPKIKRKSTVFTTSTVQMSVPDDFRGPFRLYLKVEHPKHDSDVNPYDPRKLNFQVEFDGVTARYREGSGYSSGDGSGGILLCFLSERKPDKKDGVLKVVFNESEIDLVRANYGQTEFVLSSGRTL